MLRKKIDAIEHGQYCHGDAASQSAFHAGGDRIDLQRKPGALYLLCHRQAHDLAAGVNTGSASRTDRYLSHGAHAEEPGETIPLRQPDRASHPER